MPTYLYANDGTTLVGAMASTSLLSDVGVDDQTTGPPGASDTDSYENFGLPCAGTLGCVAVQTAVWDGLGPYTITAIRATGYGFTQHSGIGVPCPFPSPAASVTITSLLYVSTDGVSWTLLQTDTASGIALGATTWHTRTWSGSVTARYVKRVLTCQISYFGITGSAEARAQNSDLRVTGTPDCSAPTTPTGFAVGNVCSVTGDSLPLSWNAVGGASGYTVRDAATRAVVYSGAGTGTTVAGLTAGQSYSFEVMASNACGDSAWSSAVSGIPSRAPVAPVLSGERSCCNRKHILTWADVPFATAYRLYQVGTPDVLLYDGALLTFTHDLTGPERRVSQTYQLIAYNGCGASAADSVTVGPQWASGDEPCAAWAGPQTVGTVWVGSETMIGSWTGPECE